MFTYVYNDDEMMREEMFPTLFSLTDTEQVEGEVIISFLKQMRFRYVDIWYHRFSEEMAKHVYESYVRNVEFGCGRMEDISNVGEVGKIDEMYNKTGGSEASSQVQLILSNSEDTTNAMLKHMVDNLGFENKIYILGMSNGRFRSLGTYKSVMRRAKGSTLILPLATLLNADLRTLKEKLRSGESSRDSDLDKVEQEVRNRLNWYDGGSGYTYDVTSWTPYIVGGVKILTQLLQQYLVATPGDVCMDYLRSSIFLATKNNETRNKVSIDDDLTLNFTWSQRVLNTGYEIGVYQSDSDSFSILGKAFPDSVTITNTTLLQQISIYNQTCSTSCRPGFFRKPDKSNLSCCWTCQTCASHTISTINNSADCQTCLENETADFNNTSCVQVPGLYIDSSSPYFIGGTVCAGFGLFVVLVFGMIVFRHTDRPSIRASDPGYLYTMLASVTLGFLTSLIPLTEPLNLTCGAEYVCFMAFTTLVSTTLAMKCNKIYEIFRAAGSFETPKCGWILKNTTIVQVLSLLLVLTLALLDVLVWGPGWSVEIIHTPHRPYHQVCQLEGEGSILPSIVPLILPTAAFLATLVLASLMRHFPHNFRETLNIFGATLIVLLCCLMFLTGYSLADNYFKGLLRAIVLFVSSLSFLLCIFLPKIYFLYQRDLNVNHNAEVIGRNSLRNYLDKDVLSNRIKSVSDHSC